MPNTFESIATFTASGSTNTISFTSLTQAYTDLQLVVTAAISGGNYAKFVFNSDTSAIYSRTEGYTSPGSTQGVFTTGDAVIMAISDSTTTPWLNIIDIFNYSGSSFSKTWIYNHQIYNSNNDNGIGNYNSSAPITRIDIVSNNGANFTAGGVFALYGIKAA